MYDFYRKVMPPYKRDYGQCVKSQSSVSSFTPEEEERLSKDIRHTYGFSSTEELLNFCFQKKYIRLCNTPHHVKHADMQLYSSEKWTVRLSELIGLKCIRKYEYFFCINLDTHVQFRRPVSSNILTSPQINVRLIFL